MKNFFSLSHFLYLSILDPVDFVCWVLDRKVHQRFRRKKLWCRFPLWTTLDSVLPFPYVVLHSIAMADDRYKLCKYFQTYQLWFYRIYWVSLLLWIRICNWWGKIIFIFIINIQIIITVIRKLHAEPRGSHLHDRISISLRTECPEKNRGETLDDKTKIWETKT